MQIRTHSIAKLGLLIFLTTALSPVWAADKTTKGAAAGAGIGLVTGGGKGAAKGAVLGAGAGALSESGKKKETKKK